MRRGRTPRPRPAQNPAVPAPTHASPVPGAHWRHLDPDRDVDAYVRLLEASRSADRGAEVTTAEIARRALTDPLAPPETNVIGLADRDGNLLGMARVEERLRGDSARRAFVWGTTHPAYRDLGIGTTLAGWAVARAAQVLCAAPGDLPRYVETFLDAPLVDARQVYERLGLRAVRWYADMQRDLSEPLPPMPDLGAVRIVPYSAAEPDAIRAAHNEAFADHWGSEPIPEDIWTRDVTTSPSFRPDVSFVAMEGDEVVGYSTDWVAEADWAATGVRDGWVGSLGVRRPWRKRGVATGLLVAALEAFRAAGLEAATLCVDMENPTGAVGIYERVGFRSIRRFVRLRTRVEELALA